VALSLESLSELLLELALFAVLDAAAGGAVVVLATGTPAAWGSVVSAALVAEVTSDEVALWLTEDDEEDDCDGDGDDEDDDEDEGDDEGALSALPRAEVEGLAGLGAGTGAATGVGMAAGLGVTAEIGVALEAGLGAGEGVAAAGGVDVWLDSPAVCA